MTVELMVDKTGDKGSGNRYGYVFMRQCSAIVKAIHGIITYS